MSRQVLTLQLKASATMLATKRHVDILARLKQEQFKTLTLHWATSPTSLLQGVHHAPAISAKGDRVEDGIILDGWRDGGRLFWAPVQADPSYNWQDLNDVQGLLQARRDRML